MKNAPSRTEPTDPLPDVAEVVNLLLTLPGGEGASDQIVERLAELPGELVWQVIQGVAAQATPAAAGAPVSGGEEHSTEHWREELMACRARTWPSPAQAGLLVGPRVLILTDGQRGVMLSAQGVRVLGGSMSGSLMLLCQTIVMTEHAVNAQDLGNLRQQRTESASTTLSEIQPIR